ncbi:PREDICTED: ufm1-specific protease 1-like isoform X2 [Priapulus caudatus]|nr:PREDICTED: ufm1-specific protease 1-like isoform X2 [Priapulus caudatus]XP_014677872.1 PREDICTED: ufm1-specific protease 1-like isoform X2 [Priapulus caudatus]XP_014677874.1 PREDICTED: ufm1-specific protease 1-like isoform X2 [Priapulus caudatus]
MPLYCAVPLCNRSGGHMFPKDDELCKKWVVAIKRLKPDSKQLWQPGKYHVVCHRHFKETDYKPPGLLGLRKLLLPSAVPSVFDFKPTSTPAAQRRDERGLKRRKLFSPIPNIGAPCPMALDLIQSIHNGLPLPHGSVQHELVRGTYDYWHYLCDQLDDRGWGCGYRTLQTICSWTSNQLRLREQPSPHVPSIPEIQHILVKLGDKEAEYVGSREWIGSFEICLIIDHVYSVPCKILHVSGGVQELESHAEQLLDHFMKYGSPVMMGGSTDTSSKAILGVARSDDGLHLLVLDPHFVGKGSAKKIQEENWIKWRHVSSFTDTTFYNICCPLLKAR